MKVGVRDGTIRQGWDVIFAEAKKVGFDGVELDIGGDYQKSPLWTEQGRADIKRRCAEAGIEVSCVCMGGLWKVSPASPDAAMRAEALSFVEGVIRACADIGAKVILVPVSDAKQGYDVVKPRWIELLKKAAPLAEQLKVCLAVENCGCSVPYLLELAQPVNSPYVAAYFDVSNSKVCGFDPVAEIRLLGKKWLAHVHMKDTAIAPDGKRAGCRLGLGVVDQRACVAALTQAGYDGYLTLETPPGQNPLVEAAWNLGYLRALI